MILLRTQFFQLKANLEIRVALIRLYLYLLVQAFISRPAAYRAYKRNSNQLGLIEFLMAMNTND
jgi:hypothetical protein